MKKLFYEMLDWMNQNEDFVLVSIIAGSGSTPRGAGARMIVKKDKMFGTIGGGAVEYKASKLALEVLQEKKSYTKGFLLAKNQVADLGMICGGDVVVYFQYISYQNIKFKELCSKAIKAFDIDEDSWIITEITDETAWEMGLYSKSQGLIGMNIENIEPLLLTRAVQVDIENHKYYSEPLVKAGTVYIFGGGHVGQELVPVLAHLGFRCVVFDDREEFANKELFPLAEKTIVGDFENIFDKITITENDYLAIMSRGHQFDYLVQKQALLTKAHYIGVMGSRAKMKIIREKLIADAFDDTAIERFHSPIGIEILAETPAEIAISIAGELIKVRALRQGSEK